MAERHDSCGADRVKHRKRIRASLCHRRQRIDRVGQPRAPLVEADHACHPRQLKDERPVRCVLPFQIQVRDQARDEQQVNQPTSANLKRNVSVAATRVPGLQLHILHYHIPPARRILPRRPVRPAPLAPAATAPSASSPSRPCWSPRSASTFASSAPRRTGGCFAAPAAACSASRSTAASGTSPARQRSTRTWPQPHSAAAPTSQGGRADRARLVALACQYGLAVLAARDEEITSST